MNSRMAAGASSPFTVLPPGSWNRGCVGGGAIQPLPRRRPSMDCGDRPGRRGRAPGAAPSGLSALGPPPAASPERKAGGGGSGLRGSSVASCSVLGQRHQAFAPSHKSRDVGSKGSGRQDITTGPGAQARRGGGLQAASQQPWPDRAPRGVFGTHSAAPTTGQQPQG